MMYVLQENSSETAKYLVNVVNTLKIMDYNVENAGIVVSLIRGAVSRLSNLVDSSGQSAFPGEFSDYFLGIFKTTSVTEFNALFSNYSIAARLTKFKTKMSNKPRISEI